MRVLLWHGWLLEGSGSNVYTAKVAEVLRRVGHDVLLLCQEPHPESFEWIDAFGTAGPGGPSELTPTGAAEASGRCVVLRPEIGSLLPVFVVDEYEGFEVKRFVDLTDEELRTYIERNVEALRAAAVWHGSEVGVAGHAIPGGTVAARALGPGRYLVKVHGSDIEYAARAQPRLAELVREGLEGARAVAGATNDVVDRAVEFAPHVSGRTAVVPPGVEVERFHPRPRREALLEAAELLGHAGETGRGRPGGLGWRVEMATFEDPSLFEELTHLYDQAAPDRDAGRRLRGLAANRGPIVGYFGKLIEQKGAQLFLQALTLLPMTRGLVVGFGAFRERLEGLAVALDRGDPEWVRRWEANTGVATELTDPQILAARGLSGRTVFTGRLDHRYAPYALSAMDVLVVPSILEEAFGMVAAEGAASGALPLVARHSGLAEVAEALESHVGRPGLFSFEPGPDAVHRIARGMRSLLAMPRAERDELRRGISSFVAREWTWDGTAQKLLAAAIRPRPAGPQPAAPPASTR